MNYPTYVIVSSLCMGIEFVSTKSADGPWCEIIEHITVETPENNVSSTKWYQTRHLYLRSHSRMLA